MTMRRDQLIALSSYLAQRRTAVIDTWRHKVAADRTLTTGASLPKAQLHDHLPALLEDFERRLAAGDSAMHAGAAADYKTDAAAHGLQRWQQGFGLSEVSRELGHLNECVVVELDRCAVQHPEFESGVMAEARRIWASLFSVTVASSVSRYFELQQIEAAGQVADVEQALNSLRELEAQRAELWQQAAHDLRGNLGAVALAAAGLAAAQTEQDRQRKFLASLDRNVRALHRLLEDVTNLARLQSGQEVRNLAQLDAPQLLRELAQDLAPMAAERGLLLGFDGPDSLWVDGDAVKIGRIVQNLVINAIKYTRHGGVDVTWGSNTADADRWFIQVEDTGPGFHAGPGALLAGALEAATDQAGQVAERDTAGDAAHAGPVVTGLAGRFDSRAVRQQQGEGIGLSIVKRLCELLDATIEMNSKVREGTVFRILLPKRYTD